MDFKIGDSVEAFGCLGKVTGIDEYINVHFEDDYSSICFFLDGKYSSWHKDPSLKFISREKQKIKKKMYTAIYKRSLSGFSQSNWLFENEDQAKESYDNFVCLGPEIIVETEE